jgi:hypothetical protein
MGSADIFSNNCIADKEVIKRFSHDCMIKKQDALEMCWDDVGSGKKVVFIRPIDGITNRVFVAQAVRKESFVFQMAIAMHLNFKAVSIFLVDEDFSVLPEPYKEAVGAVEAIIECCAA